MTDAIVLGGGVNELVAAHMLARAGKRVLVLDASAASPPDLESGWVPAEIVRELALESHGFKVVRSDPWAEAPLPSGGRLQLWQDMARSVESIRSISARDAGKWPEFCERMARLARLLERIYAAPPPDPLSERWSDLLQLAGLGWQARRLGRQGLEDLLHLLPMPAADLLDDWFESDALKGLLGAVAVRDLRHGPRSGGTAFPLLHRHAGSPLGVFSPPLTNLRAVLRQLPGVELRRATEVARIDAASGSVKGVVLAGGEEIAAPVVVSGLDPKRTLLQLLDPAWLDPELARAVGHIRSRGVAARVLLELEREPGFTTLVVAPSLDYLEHAYDDAKYGRVSKAPLVEARSDGRRVEAYVQYVPYEAEDAERLILETLAPHLPGIVKHQIDSPRGLASVEGWPEGQPHHAELTLDQLLWMRPLPELARYRTPIGGLYLCGPAMHPGAGIAGAAGMNCARQVMAGS